MATNNPIIVKLLLVMCLCWQFLCYYIVISGDYSTCMEIERNALLSFKDDLEDPLGALSSWKDGVDCCEWKGIQCHVETGRVVGLNLRNQDFNFNGGVRGNKLNSSLVNLKDLRYLDLSGNDFQGIPIPSFIGSFKRLRYLNLSFSSFAGVVPSELGNLSNLVYLDLSRNPERNLSMNFVIWGKDLSWIFGLSYLKHLDLSDIDLSADSKLYWLETINITLPYLVELHLSNCMLSMEMLPKTLGNLCGLRKLILQGNAINGSIGELMDGFATCNKSRLEILDLSECYLSGFLPNSLGYLSNLKYLNLESNSFVGNIPKSIENLTSLVHFLAFENQLNGSIPESLGKLSLLYVLDLSFNPWNSVITERHLHNLSSLTGLSIGSNPLNTKINLSFDITFDWIPPFKLELLQISFCRLGPRFPTWLRNQNKLKNLMLHSTMLSDTIPDWFLNLGLSLYYLDLSFNNLSGKVPNTFDFENAASVVLSENHFEGPLPQFSSPNISVLLLGDNMFSGTIPHNIAQLMPKLIYYNVSNNYLYGSIPSSMGNLSSLFILDLSKNNLVGEIPNSMGNLRSLEALLLDYNNISGAIPSSISSLRSLRILSLSNMNLVGKIPSTMDNMRSLEILVLNNNYISGAMPSSISSLRSLSILSMSNMNLVGEIPRMDNMTSLEILLLNNNYISGVIPSSIGYLESLHLISLSNNNLVGEIPSSLKNCRSMLILDLADNMFSGEVPSWMGSETMQNLQVLNLRSNQLVGQIPKQLCALPNLHFLDLAHNHLSGTIPSCMGNLTAFSINPKISEQIETFTVDMKIITKGTEYVYDKTLYLVNLIDLSVNNLTGVIPRAITNLSRLWSLNLSMNQLTGRIPDEIGSLTMLETLDLSLNRLSGMLPPSLAHMTSLNHLNLSYNNFKGKIPTGNQLDTLLDPSIYMNNPGLCGTPLGMECPEDVKNQKRPIIDVDDKDEWRWIWVSMALGFTVGFWGFWGPLVMKRAWRQAYFGFVEDKFEAVMIGVARLRIKLMNSSNRN